jgi:hypothetical protein
MEYLAGLDRHGLKVDVVQIDDGWQACVGDWLEPSGRFSRCPTSPTGFVTAVGGRESGSPRLSSVRTAS